MATDTTKTDQTAGANAGGLFSGLASLVGGQALGPDLTNPNYTNAVDTLKQAQSQIQGTPVPTTAQMQLLVQNYVQQGILTPAQAATIQSDPTQLTKILTNPSLSNAQYQALAQLNQIATGGGLTPQMQAQINELQQKNATQARGASDAIMQQAQERGMGNSGTTLLAQLTNAQNEANNNYNGGLGVAAQGQQNALNALTQGGNLATTMQTNQFGQQAQVASAQDAINKFNAANAQNVNLANTTAQNQAQAANLANAQDVANKSTSAQNVASAYNAQLPQTQFKDTLDVANSNANAARNTATAEQNLGAQETQTSANTGSAITKALGDPRSSGSISNSIGNGLSKAFDYGSDTLGNIFSDKNLKTNVKKDDFDMDKFLNSVTGYKYNYKPKALAMGMPEGRQDGVMAQDLEKTPVGANLVNNTPDGKMVDYKKAGPVMMAALANLHGRLQDVEGKK